MEIRDLTEDDLNQALDVRSRSFGPLASGNRDEWNRMQKRSIADGRSLAVEDGGRVVATARINDFRQWWAGRAVRMAGVGGVVVLPEVRGRGVGSALMAAVIERSRELGFPLSALYPATVPVYRGVGYELAGVQRIASISAAALRTLAGRGPYVDVRRPAVADAEAITQLIAGLHERNRDCGPIEYRAVEWASDIEDDEYFTYVAEDGFVGYGFEDGGDTLRISHLVAGSEATLRTLWSMVGSGSSVVKTVRAPIATDDPLIWMLADRGLTIDRETWWMLRLADAEAAVAGRGYPSTVDVDVRLRLTDPLVAANDGDFRLTVAAGTGSLIRTDGGAAPQLDLSARALAALYAGWPLHTLRRTGLVTGGDTDADAQLDAAFVARPYMLDYF